MIDRVQVSWGSDHHEVAEGGFGTVVDVMVVESFNRDEISNGKCEYSTGETRKPERVRTWTSPCCGSCC